MTFLFEDGMVHFLGDGEGLVDEAVGELFHFGFGQYEAEVVLAVAAVAAAYRELRRGSEGEGLRFGFFFVSLQHENTRSNRVA